MREFEVYMALREVNSLLVRIDKNDTSELLDLKTKLEEELEQAYKVLPLSKSTKQSIDAPDLPKDPPPGFEYYQSWSNRMEELEAQIADHFIICSVCPFYLRKPDTGVPCRVFPGTLISLPENNYTCAMVSFNHWTQNELYTKVADQGAVPLLKTFEAVHASDLDKIEKEEREEYIKKVTKKIRSEVLTKFRAKEEALILLARNLTRLGAKADKD